MKLVRALFSFDGRLRRRDWWLLSALVLIVQVLSSVAVSSLLASMGEHSVLMLNTAVLAVFLMLQWPSAALNVRRFHDRGRRGWPGGLYAGVSGVLVVVLGLAGTSLSAVVHREDALGVTASALAMIWMPVTLWMFVVLALADGTSGPNRFGPSPKGVGFGPPDAIS